jgi:transposase
LYDFIMPPKQRRSTPRLTGKRDHAAMEKRRRDALSLLSDGVSQSEISRRLGVTRQAVSKWVTAKRNGGIKALASKGKPGRKTSPTPVELKKIEGALMKGPVKNGYRNDLWTLRRVAEVIARVTGRQRPSISRTWGLLREMGWSCQRPARRARQQDAEAVAEFRDKTWVAVKKRPEISGN